MLIGRRGVGRRTEGGGGGGVVTAAAAFSRQMPGVTVAAAYSDKGGSNHITGENKDKMTCRSRIGLRITFLHSLEHTVQGGASQTIPHRSTTALASYQEPLSHTSMLQDGGLRWARSLLWGWRVGIGIQVGFGAHLKAGIVEVRFRIRSGLGFG